MGKITLTADDIMKGEPHKEGWRKAAILLTATGQNKAQDGINYTFTFLLEDDPDGRTIDKIFSSKAIGMIKPLLAAVSGKTVQEFIEAVKGKPLDFDTDALVTKKVQVKIGTRMYDGRPISEVQDFAPYDTTVPF